MINRRHFIKHSAALSLITCFASFLLAANKLFGDVVHTVKKGETLSKIADKYNVSVQSIKTLNKLKSDNILVGQKLTISQSNNTSSSSNQKSASVQNVRYTVQRGDSLAKIAQKFDVSIATIKKNNALQSDTIKAGQVLLIPQAQAIAAPPSIVNRQPTITSQQSSSVGSVNYISEVVSCTRQLNIKNGRWKYIVVHHSGIERGNAKSYDRNHRSRGMEYGLAYHFIIGNGIDSKEGEIEIGPRWIKQLRGGHVRPAEVNEVGIGICLVGNFEERKPSAIQLTALYQLINYLKKEVMKEKYIMAVHKEINKTVCPGKNFPVSTLHDKYPNTIKA